MNSFLICHFKPCTLVIFTIFPSKLLVYVSLQEGAEDMFASLGGEVLPGFVTLCLF